MGGGGREDDEEKNRKKFHIYVFFSISVTHILVQRNAL